MPVAINFFYLKPCPALRNRNRLKEFVESVFDKEKKQLKNLSLIFCSDNYLLKINKDYLHHDYYTDIITFDLSTKREEICGEIYISIDRVKENANIQRVGFNEEIHRVIFHGVLHLCGYTDKTQKDKSNMTKAEDKYLKLYL